MIVLTAYMLARYYFPYLAGLYDLGFLYYYCYKGNDLSKHQLMLYGAMYTLEKYGYFKI